MTKRGRGRVALPPGDKRRVKVSPHFTDGEAARLDAVRGDVERAEWLRVVAMRDVVQREKRARRQPVAAPVVGAVGRWVLSFGDMVRWHEPHRDAAAEVTPRGWTAWHRFNPNPPFTIDAGPETGPEGQRLSDAALRAAGYVLEGEVAP